ncbi:hypothetical protein [Clostridium botulinum]|uniref:hypothetical protein n=1 Tax=Clostridium botulinum TaxID=1491 RepID=UPI00174E1AE9|nr:hypothetical protein [Clostridium botulinum]MBD5589274.1 hypothetical protein [Clostridium botulinum]
MNINNKKDLEKLLNFTFYISGECPNEILGCNISCKTVENCVMCWRKALSERIDILKEGE